MALYTNGTALNKDDFYQLVRAHLGANGWTEHDILSDVVDTRDIVFKGTALDATTGNACLLRLALSAGKMYGICYADWDPTNNVGSLQAGNGNSTIQVATTPFAYWLRTNGTSLAIATEVSTTYKFNYYGFVRRGRGQAVSGTTSLATAVTAGTNVVTVNSDMTTRLRVGQTVQIIDQSHSNASGTWGNIEAVVISAITATTITFTTNLVNAYSAGSFVGADPCPAISTAASNTNPGVSPYFSYSLNGAWTSGTSEAGSFAADIGNATAIGNLQPGYGGERPVGVWAVDSNKAGVYARRGTLYHYLSGGFQGSNAQDLIDEGDGVTDAVILYTAQTGLAMLRG